MTTTQEKEFTILDDFPPVGYDEWREVVEKQLGGAPFERKLVRKTYEGIEVQPIYSRRDENAGEDPFGYPGLAAFIRGGSPLGAVEHGWDLRQEFADPRLKVTHQNVLNDLQGGVTSLHLRLDRAARNGLDPDHAEATELAGQDGVMAYCVNDLDEALADVHLNMIQVAIDAGAAFVPAAAMLAGLWKKRGVAANEARGAFNADPLAALAREGQLPLGGTRALTLMADLAKWTSENHPNVTSVGVDTSPYHDAGASAAQDIAFAAATGVEYLRAMTDAGLQIDGAAKQILFRMGLGTNHFLVIAKLRAARWVWSRVVEACGGSGESCAMGIHARTGNRVLTQFDPYVNLLRNSVAVFAAGLGGADAITSVPFDAMAGLPDDFSRRVARNTVLVLQEEAHLDRVVDPAGGSWFLDQLTEELANHAWEIFQKTESQGGMLSALKSGWIAEQIEGAFQPRAKDIARRKQGITGVSEFPDVAEEPVTQKPPDLESLQSEAAARIVSARKSDSIELPSSTDAISTAVNEAAEGATIGQIANALGFRTDSSESMSAIDPRNFAEPFEKLRDACDAWQATHGHRPRIFQVNLGPPAHHVGRATWSKNFFEAGGFEVLGNDGFQEVDEAAAAFAESGAPLAVICSSDKLYAKMMPQAAAKLKEAGADTIVLAGHPGDNEQAWKEAGVDQFIYMKCNVLETLRELLQQQGVLERMSQNHE